MTRYIVIVLAALASTAIVHADTYHVYSGQSIQNAITEAIGGDEIVVHPGTYVERLDLLGRAITLRSSDGPVVTIIDGDAGGSVITCASGEGPDTVIEGLTITNGSTAQGGGMFNQNSSPTLNDCYFRGNTADAVVLYVYGGGMYNENGNPTLNDCTFFDNSAYDGGGGMYNIGGTLTLTGCTFSGNISWHSGAGMRNHDGGLTLIDCHFNGNSILSQPGWNGGGLYNENCELTLIHCTISGHVIYGQGGGMYCDGSNLAITNCVFRGNRSTGSDEGGAIYLCNYSTATLANCTFSDNVAFLGGAIWPTNYSTATLVNCIVWSNADGYQFGSTAVSATYSCIKGGWLGNGNIDTDPLLDHTLRPGLGSPCIDAGDNTAVPPDTYDLDGDGDMTEPIPMDILGMQRFHDDAMTADTGVGAAPIVDMGACEYGAAPTPPALPGDLDGDCDVDLSDLAELLAHYGEVCE